MFSYKALMLYPINIKSKDLKMAKLILSALAGPQGELGASTRYLSQRINMPDDVGKALLNDIGTEELSHVEMLQEMIHQLMKDATVDEIKKAGLESYFIEHGKDVFFENDSGNSFTTDYISAVGDPIADVVEDMAAEQKARTIYEHLILMTKDQDVIQPLLFLRQREVVHFERFKELFERYKKMGY